MMKNKHMAIVVGGGPAPGINGVISSAVIEAANRGYRVLGIHDGFSHIMLGEESCIRDLTIREVSRIDSEGGSIIGTSRANPAKNEQHLRNVCSMLKRLDIGYLITIGGDDTATTAMAIDEKTGDKVRCAHIPKTIDNDLPLPGYFSTFGFQTAREVGAQIVETLREDAKTTKRWYFVVSMGRKSGHLALGIGISAGATMTIIPEEFLGGKIPMAHLVDVVVGSMLKRSAWGSPFGVVVMAEGLVEKVDLATISDLSMVERDPHGNIRLSEVDFSGIVVNQVRARLRELGVDLAVVRKDVGYELRCAPPNAFDREYTRVLGFGAVDFLLTGGTGAMITRQGDMLVPVPFSELLDPTTGRAKVRYIDVNSLTYLVARKYMIRLTTHDLEDTSLMERIASLTNKTAEELKEQFAASLSTVSSYSDFTSAQ